MFGFHCNGYGKELHLKLVALFLTSMYTPMNPKSPYVQTIVRASQLIGATLPNSYETISMVT